MLEAPRNNVLNETFKQFFLVLKNVIRPMKYLQECSSTSQCKEGPRKDHGQVRNPLSTIPPPLPRVPTSERPVLSGLLPLYVLRHRVLLALAVPQLRLEVVVVCVARQGLAGLPQVVLHTRPLILQLLQADGGGRVGQGTERGEGAVVGLEEVGDRVGD